MAFGRPSPEGVCPRCDQLRKGEGDKPRKAWDHDKKEQERRDAEARRKHFAPGGEHEKIMKRGGVDTAFDW